MKIKGCKRQPFLDQAVLNGGQPIFYLIKCWDKEETFYKLGITMNNILTRYGTVKAMPYEWSILLEHPGTAEEVYDMEVAFKKEMNQYHYKPKMSFNGSGTECYTELSEALQQLIE
ncbi:hypothetical protein [Acinetobacter pittii]|uniref:hypothetical protein n=1 Tax=Acinetobacter pittii TaxID=48296 RepID=UPI000E5A2025|nr:hypothetical protein [Acinetobacter pittii]